MKNRFPIYPGEDDAAKIRYTNSLNRQENAARHLIPVHHTYTRGKGTEVPLPLWCYSATKGMAPSSKRPHNAPKPVQGLPLVGKLSPERQLMRWNKSKAFRCRKKIKSDALSYSPHNKATLSPRENRCGFLAPRPSYDSLSAVFLMKMTVYRLRCGARHSLSLIHI